MAFNSTDTKYKMEIVLRGRRAGKPRELCAKAAKIPLSRFTHWCNEGKQKIGKDNIYFYNTLMEIEEELENRRKYEMESKIFSTLANINKRVEFLNSISDGQTRDKASKNAKLELKLIDKWISLGRKKIKPFYKFYRDYSHARDDAKRKERINEE